MAIISVTEGLLVPWQGPGELMANGWAAVAYPGVAVASDGSHVCAVDGGLVIALEGSRVWAWDGGVVHARAGSTVYAGPYGRVDAGHGSVVTAKGEGDSRNREPWPLVVARGGSVSGWLADVVAGEGSHVAMDEEVRVTVHGDRRVAVSTGRGGEVLYSDQPMPAMLAPEPSRLAGRPVLPAEPMTPPGQPVPELGLPREVVDWLEPLCGVLRGLGARVAEQWAPAPRRPERLYSGRVSNRKVARLIALPPTVVPQTQGYWAIWNDSYDSTALITPGRVPRQWLRR